MNWLGRFVQKNIEYTDTVLDLGCGIMQATDDMKARTILGCDIWEIYLNKIKDIHPTIRISCEETDRFMDSSYDVVICLDVIEHLPFELAIKMLDECKRICRKKAVIYTPSQFDSNEQSKDGAWGLGENKHQKHKCVITRKEIIEHGYNVNPMADSIFGVYEKNGNSI